MHTRCRAFTLVEILIVVVILGVLAAIIVPQATSATQESRFAAVVQMYDSFDTSVTMFFANTGRLPEDGFPGAMPAELAPFLDIDAWNSATPLGGRWDWNGAGSGVFDESNIAVRSDAADVALWLAFDEYADDADLSTGLYIREANHLLRSVR